MRIAVLGAGSIGTIVGAYIAAGGENIELIDANREHVAALNASGAKITGTTEFQTNHVRKHVRYIRFGLTINKTIT